MCHWVYIRCHRVIIRCHSVSTHCHCVSLMCHLSTKRCKNVSWVSSFDDTIQTLICNIMLHQFCNQLLSCLLWWLLYAIIVIFFIIPFQTQIYWVLTLSLSPKELGIFSRIGLVAHSEQRAYGTVCFLGIIHHRRFPRENTDTLGNFWHCMTWLELAVV